MLTDNPTAGTPVNVCHPISSEKTNDLYFCSVMYLHQPYRLVFLFRLKTT
jgi:hypothetical protein